MKLKGKHQVQHTEGNLYLNKTFTRLKIVTWKVFFIHTIKFEKSSWSWFHFAVTYEKLGGEALLKPGTVSGTITSITWKHGPDIAVEWYGKETFMYREFKGTLTQDLPEDRYRSCRAMKKYLPPSWSLSFCHRCQI